MARKFMKHKIWGYYTVAIALHSFVLFVDIAVLVMAVVAFIPDHYYNHYLDDIVTYNRIDDFFDHAEFYITIDHNAYLKNKKAYDAAQSQTIIDGYVKTLKPDPGHKNPSSLMPFGTFEKLKGELYNRSEDILRLEQKELNLQIAVIALIILVLSTSIIELGLCLTMYKAKKIFRPLNTAFHATTSLIILACGIMYIISSKQITSNYNEVANIVKKLSIETYKTGGFIYPYQTPADVKLNPDHIIASCGFFGYKERGSNDIRGGPPSGTCHRGLLKFICMVTLGFALLNYVALTFLTMYFWGVLTRRRNQVLPMESEATVADGETAEGKGAGNKRASTTSVTSTGREILRLKYGAHPSQAHD